MESSSCRLAGDRILRRADRGGPKSFGFYGTRLPSTEERVRVVVDANPEDHDAGQLAADIPIDDRRGPPGDAHCRVSGSLTPRARTVMRAGRSRWSELRPPGSGIRRP